MIRLTIVSQKHGTVTKEFDNQLQVDAYIDEVTQSQHWGTNAWTEVIPAIKDGEVVITPEKTIEHDATWSWSQQDITSEINAKKLLEYRIAKQDFGAQLIAEITNLNTTKGLTALQLDTLLSETAAMKLERLLWSGSLDFAKDAINAYPGSLYTAQDKQMLIGKINDWLSKNPSPV